MPRGNDEWRKAWWNTTRKLWVTQSMMEYHKETMSDSKHDGIPRGNCEWRKGWWNAWGNYEWLKAWWIPRGNYEWLKAWWNTTRKLWVTQRIMECKGRKRRYSFSWEKCTYPSISSAWQFDYEDHYFPKRLQHTSISVRWISRSADVPSENLRPPGKREQNTEQNYYDNCGCDIPPPPKKKWNIKVEHHSFTNSINFIHKDDTRFMISCIAWKKKLWLTIR